MSSTLSTLNTTTEVLEQGTDHPTTPWAPRHKWLPTAQGVCSRCVFTAVCTLDGLIAEHKFRVWVTILGHMSRHSLLLVFIRLF